MTRDDEGTLAVFGCLGIVAMMPLIYVFDGYVLSVLWKWFAVPVFHLPALAIPYAIGISIIMSLLTHQEVPAEKKDDSGSITKCFNILGKALVRPAMALFIGWIVRMFVWAK